MCRENSDEQEDMLPSWSCHWDKGEVFTFLKDPLWPDSKCVTLKMVQITTWPGYVKLWRIFRVSEAFKVNIRESKPLVNNHTDQGAMGWGRLFILERKSGGSKMRRLEDYGGAQHGWTSKMLCQVKEASHKGHMSCDSITLKYAEKAIPQTQKVLNHTLKFLIKVNFTLI